jgi:ankyrin repeat protein
MSTNTAQETEFFDAIKHGRRDEVRALVGQTPGLLQARDDCSFGGTALNISIFRHDRGMIDTLLELGADPNDQSDWWAGPWNAMQSALQSGQPELAEYLVRQGATVGVHEAAGLSRVRDLKTLLEQDPARVHQRGGDGCMPLHFAGSTEVVDVLIDNGADIDARDIDHYSTAAQYLAKSQPEVTRYLFSRGATADIFSAIMADDLPVLRRLIESDPQVLQQRINRETFPPGPDHEVDNIMTFTIGHNATPMHAAATAERLDMIDLMVESGINVDATGGYDDSSSMHLAAWNDSLKVAKKLVERGADINKRSGKIHNNSPAGWAIVAGSVDVFNFLIDRGAEQLDHFLVDAEASTRGDNLQFKCVPMENYQRILTRLRSAASQ